jgi:hypothetical protein
MLNLDYICSSQLSSIGRNRHEKQNVVIRDLKTRYMLLSKIKNPMYSFKSKSDMKIFTPRHVSARLDIHFKISSIGTNRHAKQNVLIRDLKTRYMLLQGIKYTIYTFKSRLDWIIFIPRRVEIDYI